MPREEKGMPEIFSASPVSQACRRVIASGPFSRGMAHCEGSEELILEEKRKKKQRKEMI